MRSAWWVVDFKGFVVSVIFQGGSGGGGVKGLALVRAWWWVGKMMSQAFRFLYLDEMMTGGDYEESAGDVCCWCFLG